MINHSLNRTHCGGLAQTVNVTKSMSCLLSHIFSCNLTFVAAAVQSAPLVLDGMGPGSSIADVRTRFPNAKCKSEEIRIGNQRDLVEYCVVNSVFDGSRAEYRISFEKSKVSGIGILIPTAGNTLDVARKTLEFLTQQLGPPTEVNPKVLQTANPEFEVVALWLQRPTRSIYLRVCNPKTFGTSLLCQESRVIIDATYKVPSQP